MHRAKQHEPPLVSIVMPTHDRPAELGIAIQSVLEQSHERWELIVVNDGGPDVATLLRSLDRGGRIVYVRLPSARGAGAARNVALALARGEYVTYLDDDDWYDAEHLARLVAVLEQGEHAVAYTDSRRVIEQRQDGRYRPIGVQQPYYAVDFDADALLVNNYIPILAIMHRRDCLAAVGGFDESLPVLEDWELWIRLSRRFDFVRVPGVSCTVRWRTDGTTTTTGRRREHLSTAALIHARHHDGAARRPDIVAARAQLIECLRAQCEPLAPCCSLVIGLGPESDAATLLAGLGAIAERSVRTSYEVVLVDDGVGPEVAQLFASLGGDVRVVRTAGAEGLGASLALGAEHARGAFLVLVAADALVRESWLDALVASAVSHPGTAALGPVLLDRCGRVSDAGLRLDRATGTLSSPHRGAAAHGRAFCARTPVEALSHGAVLVPRAAYLAAGGLDPRFVGELSVVELCLRLARQGEVAIVPESLAYREPVDHARSAADLARLLASTGEDAAAAVDPSAPRARDQARFAIQGASRPCPSASSSTLSTSAS